MKKPRLVLVNRYILSAMLERMRDSAKPLYSVYQRKTGTYLFTDEMWRKADPYEFGLYQKLSRSLTKS